ncbi:hypothetical protein HMPREF1395_00255 [Helicobacter pylori GAM112Ai]|nr:hypothetical protein HMPREF1395_00255 [Helicobacter pylori GAM112Ai]EMH32927.1 hypothetical protein HMPREF1424_00834 [Helicobacter pylori GAM42Ai]
MLFNTIFDNSPLLKAPFLGGAFGLTKPLFFEKRATKNPH